ncbi:MULTISPECIES: MGMT family protein [unclassified Niallia]|uniref:MGMT family protein n=1 Tax=unclassified Niallia TaxID=2837522 RepID=UPI001EDA866F|nr:MULTISPECIES: MGMT family protein [unclassified Niallia]MDL0435397.1 MGMT family protein [Niallia sp. SS-2023]UPO87587.1 MGMT family protein [Niallia sp. Man26]
MTPFTEKVIEIIQAIPYGKIMTYGQIAKAAGSPRGARQVVRILHTSSRKHNLPWHRVVNAKGEIVIKQEEGSAMQKQFLESEGVEFISANKLELKRYQHIPLEEWERDYFDE